MKILTEASKQSVIQAIEEWIDLLANEDYVSAADFLQSEVDNEWTPDLLKGVIEGHRVHRDQIGHSIVSRPSETLKGLKPRQDVTFVSGRGQIVGEVWYDMPLLGEWSDLTATFLLLKTEGGSTLVLENLHMM